MRQLNVLLLSFLVTASLFAQKVSNIRTETKNGRIEITYDLSGSEDCSISVVATSSDESTITPTSLFGDAGSVTPGKNKLMLWEPQLEGRPLAGWSIMLEALADLGIKWISVEGGTFRMGSNENNDEKPIHDVTVSSFKMSATEITFDQYDLYCNATGKNRPSDNGWGRGNHPVINVSWNDAVEYCTWASRQTGKTVRLPTEAEWEYAARGGNKSRNYKYSGSDDIGSVAWYGGNSYSKTQDVATQKANELGLYDMSGNVYEWCQDWYDENYYSNSPSANPQGPSSGQYRVLRGGSWYFFDNSCRVAFRSWSLPDLRVDFYGFRVIQN
jgi:formylglycine-generating enzyme required for sulfatase activity